MELEDRQIGREYRQTKSRASTQRQRLERVREKNEWSAHNLEYLKPMSLRHFNSSSSTPSFGRFVSLCLPHTFVFCYSFHYIIILHNKMRVNCTIEMSKCQSEREKRKEIHQLGGPDHRQCSLPEVRPEPSKNYTFIIIIIHCSMSAFVRFFFLLLFFIVVEFFHFHFLIFFLLLRFTF